MPIIKSTLEQKWYYRVVKVIFLLLPFFMFLILILPGKINIGTISSESNVEVFRNHFLYFVIGLLTFFLILEGIWRLCLYFLFGKIENDTKIKRSQSSQPVTLGNAATQSVAPAAQPMTQGNAATQSINSAAQHVTPAAQPAPGKPNPKTGKIVRTCLVIMVLVGFGVFAVFQVGKILLPNIDLGFLEFLNLPTPENGLPYGSGPEAYQYWIGDMPNTYYVLNMIGERAIQVTGKPYMVVKYNNITQEILDVEFGVSEVIVGANTTDWPAVTGPFFTVNWVDFHEKLGLKYTVYMLVGWDNPMAGVGWNKSINHGVQQISFEWGNGSGTSKVSENWTFTYTGESMTGGVTNLDTYSYSGEDSDTNAFKLRRIQ